MSDAPPKSAVELAMEKLARQDAAEGAEARSVTEDQKRDIADARREYEARVAECRILHESQLSAVAEPEARSELEANFRRDLARLATDRDRKIEQVLKAG